MPEAQKTSVQPAMPVAGWLDRLSGHVERHQGFWSALGRLENRWLKDRLAALPAPEPIQVCGLARSGSTIILEILNRHPATASHSYRDFPLINAPWLWNRFLDNSATATAEPTERAHKDRIKVTPDSPEAMEERLWMTFFPDCHDPDQTSVLDAVVRRPAFEQCYIDHLKKMTLIRGGRRYLAKGNYNLTRLEYILKLFPRARLVVPIREPGAQVASLVKQHRLFCREEAVNPPVSRYLRRVGHFEFGGNRRPVNIGDAGAVSRIRELWARGEDARGYAVQWASLYGWLHQRLGADPALRDAVLVVRYEDLCSESEATLTRLFAHCGLDQAGQIIEFYKNELSLPDYYRSPLSKEDLAAVRQETAETAALFGY